MAHLVSDIRSGLRMLAKYPMLSSIAIITLGLGIGLGTTVFCVVNSALFKGLPFPDADRLMMIAVSTPAQNQGRQPIGAQDLAVVREQQSAFETVGAFQITPINLAIADARPERFSAAQITAGALAALGVEPVMGRGLRQQDDEPGADPVVMIGYDLWQQRYGGASDIIGRSIRTNGTARTVVGVMPPNFGFPIRESLWIPLRIDPLATRRGDGPSYQVVGKLLPGASLAQANAQLATIASDLEREFPDTNKGKAIAAMPYTRAFFGDEIFTLLYTMLGAGIGVLLIACVNVSNLLLARASLRQKEVAVRMALGAGRGRVLRQHLTEVLVLAVAGAGVGILLSIGGMQLFLQQISNDPPPFWITFDLDFRIALFVLGLIVLSSVFAGMLPSLHAARVSAGSILKDDSRGATGTRIGKFSNALVVAELAVSCGLLIAAGLMIKSVVQLKTLPMPFAIERVLTARVDLPQAAYPDSNASIRFFEQLLPRLQAVPGVEAATLSDGLPAAGNGVIPVQIEGKTYPEASDYPLAREGIVTPGYFSTFQTPILAGREFAAGDTAGAPAVAIVNTSFVRLHYPGSNSVGRQFRRIRPNNAEPWLTIVGVVPDLLMEGIGNNTASPVGYYIPIAQSDVANGVRIAVRARGDAASLTPLIRSAVASLDGSLAIWEVKTMQQVIEQQTWFYTVFGAFFMAFGICALLLAAAGLYGVMSFAVTQRTREMGVRSALGAQGRELIMLVMRRTLAQLTIGLVLGLGLAALASGALQPVLYHVDPRDAFVFVTVILTLAAASLLASFLPARRVTTIDPVTALVVE